MRADHKLEREVAAICDLPREELVAAWVKAHGCPPPKGVKRGLLERSAAWHLQARRLGGLSTHARRAIRQYTKQREMERQVAKGSAGADNSGCVASSDLVRPNSVGTAGSAAASAAAMIKPPPAPGTRLMREWNGRMHVVDITEDGILFDGKLYRSLTAVARRITGTHWSGPRFFGL
ncbi:DUF2924 domain-containing protein [Nitratireductor mangrovi]|uniref:DUF2924 domain-containing protein n=1 Tax=Nitratireductor mangrovi TaxID=2599600 RepID=A0A5B8KXY5_9HYPH|nr:DUF2924 domain-containing protein [Nitratireductor mangrovi]QDZ00574.1 DUF2924 domain-containing protein [Nitratireductor mangrovi]